MENNYNISGIFHKDTEKIFTNVEEYISWYLKLKRKNSKDRIKKIEGCRWIGILIHRNNWRDKNLEVEHSLIEKLEDLGVKVIPVFSYASLSEEDDGKDFSSIVKDYFSFTGKVLIDGLVNFQIIAALGRREGEDILKGAVVNFQELNIPIFKPIISYYEDVESWEKNLKGVSLELSNAFTIPETIGSIEPIILGGRNKNGKIEAIEERIERFSQRILKWIDLRHTPNYSKKIGLILHNAPCSGVEATIGLGVGLQVFDSTIEIMNRLKKEGYNVEDIPESGEQLKDIIMERKAYQDFRWTSVEDIAASGGYLYKMTKDQYQEIYKDIPIKSREKIEAMWGEPLGESMVHEDHIVITGIAFGNIVVMVQPKRGCYGAKCTGEVCKILHDASCPPPHNYIATYRYLERIIKASAVVHIGTSGSLEFLPGKANALSGECYPDIVLGNLPNIYVYNSSIGGEGANAKRRGNAVIIDHLPASRAFHSQYLRVLNEIDNYLEGSEATKEQRSLIEDSILRNIAGIQGALDIVKKEENFSEGIKALRNNLLQLINKGALEEDHILGQRPCKEYIIALIKEYLDSSKEGRKIKNTGGNTALIEFIDNALVQWQGEPEEPRDPELQKAAEQVLQLYDKLTFMEPEIDNVISALEGQYIEPGMAGVPGESLDKILPTGRNFYLLDSDKVPTREAYEVGKILAQRVIERYRVEKGKIPEKISMNMISTDISVTKGEQLSQILYFMGVTPVWNENNRVEDLELIPMEKLKRPRIDVTVRISGVLRDTFPKVIELIDRAVILAVNCKEHKELNYVKKNTEKIKDVLKKRGSQEDIDRRATIRVFGDKPGTYGSGVDLALKASAWENEEDIAKVFIQFSSYGYGKGFNGENTNKEFVENIKESDISYEKSSSQRYDTLSSSFASGVQGGFNMVKKAFKGEAITQYHGSAIDKENPEIKLLQEEIKETLQGTLLNPIWKEEMKKKGYKGAADIMNSIQSIFSWQCLCENIDNKDMDNIVEQYINEEQMKKWFKDNNIYALEEISRRFLELNKRNKWQGDQEVLQELTYNYIDIEGDMEEKLEGSVGEVQGGNIDIVTGNQVETWKNNLKDIEDIFEERTGEKENE